MNVVIISLIEMKYWNKGVFELVRNVYFQIVFRLNTLCQLPQNPLVPFLTTENRSPTS